MSTTAVVHDTFVIERTYDHPAAKIFKAFSDAELKRRWFSGPPEWGDDEHQLDFRVGGAETSVGGPPGGPVITFEALYREIEQDERLVITYEMHVDGALLSISLATTELHPDGDRTRLVYTEQGVFYGGPEDVANREEGSRGLLDALDAVLSSL